MIYAGDRVVFFAPWSTWRGERGTVVPRKPGLWVLIDGDAHPVAVSDREIVRDEPSAVNLTGAE